MLCRHVRLCRFKLNFKNSVQWSSSSVTIDFPKLMFQPKFSSAEREKILDTLNEANGAQLSCLNVAESNIKSLKNYKKRNGPFKSLDELLEVDGLNMKTLEKLCIQIIADEPHKNGKLGNNDNKKLKQLLVPQLPMLLGETLSSTVGIHVAPMGVSWAKLDKTSNALECWGHQDFGNLPKKLSLTDSFKLAMNILSQLPFGDAYVFEGANGLQTQKQSSPVAPYTPHLELSSMLLALINTSRDHNSSFIDATKFDSITNCVYFLKSKVPARLFRTLVGNECVSNTAIILQLLEGRPENLTLPCSSIVVEQHLKNDYLAQPAPHKELLGQALMLTVAFMELCIKKNLDSLKALGPNRK